MFSLIGKFLNYIDLNYIFKLYIALSGKFRNYKLL